MSTEAKTNGYTEIADYKGKTVVAFCANYIYTGTFEMMNHEVLVLSDPYIVYETGAFTDEDWKDAQHLPQNEVRIERTAIESMGIVARQKKGAAKKK